MLTTKGDKMPITDETTKVIRKEIDRLNREREEIEEMIKRLEDTLVTTTRKAGKAARRVVRPKQAKRARATKTAGKDWKPTGRAAQILRIVKANPGITAAEIAKKARMKNAASVYPPLNKLKDNGMVKKQGKGFVAG